MGSRQLMCSPRRNGFTLGGTEFKESNGRGSREKTTTEQQARESATGVREQQARERATITKENSHEREQQTHERERSRERATDT